MQEKVACFRIENLFNLCQKLNLVNEKNFCIPFHHVYRFMRVENVLPCLQWRDITVYLMIFFHAVERIFYSITSNYL